MSGPEREDEKVLLTRLRSGDYKAFDTIYGYYGKLVAYKLHKLVKIPEIVEELHQDIFFKFWERRERIGADWRSFQATGICFWIACKVF